MRSRLDSVLLFVSVSVSVVGCVLGLDVSAFSASGAHLSCSLPSVTFSSYIGPQEYDTSSLLSTLPWDIGCKLEPQHADQLAGRVLVWDGSTSDCLPPDVLSRVEDLLGVAVIFAQPDPFTAPGLTSHFRFRDVSRSSHRIPMVSVSSSQLSQCLGIPNSGKYDPAHPPASIVNVSVHLSNNNSNTTNNNKFHKFYDHVAYWVVWRIIVPIVNFLILLLGLTGVGKFLFCASFTQSQATIKTSSPLPAVWASDSPPRTSTIQVNPKSLLRGFGVFRRKRATLQPVARPNSASISQVTTSKPRQSLTLEMERIAITIDHRNSSNMTAFDGAFTSAKSPQMLLAPDTGHRQQLAVPGLMGLAPVQRDTDTSLHSPVRPQIQMPRLLPASAATPTPPLEASAADTADAAARSIPWRRSSESNFDDTHNHDPSASASGSGSDVDSSPTISGDDDDDDLGASQAPKPLPNPIKKLNLGLNMGLNLDQLNGVVHEQTPRGAQQIDYITEAMNITEALHGKKNGATANGDKADKQQDAVFSMDELMSNRSQQKDPPSRGSPTAFNYQHPSPQPSPHSSNTPKYQSPMRNPVSPNSDIEKRIEHAYDRTRTLSRVDLPKTPTFSHAHLFQNISLFGLLLQILSCAIRCVWLALDPPFSAVGFFTVDVNLVLVVFDLALTAACHVSLVILFGLITFYISNHVITTRVRFTAIASLIVLVLSVIGFPFWVIFGLEGTFWRNLTSYWLLCICEIGVIVCSCAVAIAISMFLFCVPKETSGTNSHAVKLAVSLTAVSVMQITVGGVLVVGFVENITPTNLMILFGLLCGSETVCSFVRMRFFRKCMGAW